MMASRYSVDQSCSVAAFTRASAFCAAASPRTSQPASIRAAIRVFSDAFGRGAIDQQRLGGAAHAGAAHLGVDDERFCHRQVRAAIDVGVADAFQVREHRHARFVLHARDEALAAARHDHVDGAVEPLQHQADGLAVGGGHELDGGFGQARLAQAAGEANLDGAAGMMAVGAAAQDRRVAGLEAQRAGVGRHVRPALVDDADDAERHAHALDLEAVGPRPVRQHGCRPDRAVRRSPPGPWPCLRCAWDRASGDRGRRRGGWASVGGGEIELVGLDDGRSARAQLARCGSERGVLGFARAQAPAPARPRAPVRRARAWPRRRSPMFPAFFCTVAFMPCSAPCRRDAPARCGRRGREWRRSRRSSCR